MTTIVRDSNILNTVASVLRTLGHDDLNIRVEWNGRFTRRMGDAQYHSKRDAGVIRLSSPLWPRATDDQRRQTVIHEVCHVVQDRIDYKKSMQLGRTLRSSSHGHGWQMLMLRCGVTPRRCHTVDRTGLTPYAAKCACRTHGIGHRMYRNIQRGAQYRCRECGQKIEIVG